MDNQFKRTDPQRPILPTENYQAGIGNDPCPANLAVQEIADQPRSDDKPRPTKKNKFIKIILIIIGVGIALILASVVWYLSALQPVNSKAGGKEFIISPGDTPSEIAKSLKSSGLIKSDLAFIVNARLQGLQGSLKAGKYNLSPALSTSDLITELVKGPDVEIVDVTFLPGATLTDHKKVLLKAGYDEAEIDKAFSAKYDHPLFVTRPDSANLEGYILGETHRFDKGTALSAVLNRYFDDYMEIIEQNGLVERYKEQGLTLYEGITLASIIQRESVGCPGKTECEDQRQIASVFYNRLAVDMPLGSDVTYHYAADLKGVPRDHRLDSPYNTRIYKGLPPGPIASPGVSALNAAADPAKTDYMYFLSGDDDVTYFATTNEGHEANIQNHCSEKCLLP